MDERTSGINAAALLLARGSARRPALICGSRSVTYGDLRRTVPCAAAAWRMRGVQPGEVVMLRGDHGIEHAVAFLGAMWAGAVPVPMRSPLAADAAAQPVAVEFARDGARANAGIASDPGGARWMAWEPALAGVTPVPEAPCEPWAPACWTEPRTWSGGRARVLPHRFALTLSAQPGVLALTPARTMLSVLRALRRGTTVILQARVPSVPS